MLELGKGGDGLYRAWVAALRTVVQPIKAL